MSAVSLTVNGAAVRADVPPRTHLADFLREQRLLTGTHLGCEHGVCGACTLLIDDSPARSCIAFAAACEGVRVTTIEGLADDTVMVALRAAFTAEHALQCGYCTPGMLVTARDIVLRLPDADEAQIRLELAGNLCRCTGYAGIVRAIARVLRERPADAQGYRIAQSRPLARIAGEGRGEDEERVDMGPRQPRPHPPIADAMGPSLSRDAGEGHARQVRDGGARVEQTIRLSLPREAVWQALQDPAVVAGCVPGVSLTRIDGNRVEGTMEAALGPIRARFAGAATVAYGADYTGEIAGEGQDKATRLSGDARFAVAQDSDAASTLSLSIAYALRGPLAQFARGPVVQDFVAEIARIFARNLEAILQGRAVEPARRLGLLNLFWRVLRRRLRLSE